MRPQGGSTEQAVGEVKEGRRGGSKSKKKMQKENYEKPGFVFVDKMEQ